MSARGRRIRGEVALAFACTACGPTLVPSARPPLEAPDRALSCVDLVVAPLPRAEHQSVASARVLYVMHDRCPRAVRVDFAKIVVTAAYADGARGRLQPTPASDETLAGELDTQSEGSEAVWYSTPAAPEARPPSPIVALCIDASRFEGRGDADVPIDCFRRSEDGAAFAHVHAARTLDEALDPAATADASAMVSVTARRFYGEGTDSELPILCSEGRRDARSVGWCEQFGMWKRQPGLSAGLGISGHRLRAVAAGTLDLDVAWYAVSPLYIGAEGQMGSSGGSALVAGGGLVGVAAPRLGALRVRGEVMGGGWSRGDERAWVLEPRLRVDAWLTPTLSLDTWVGLGATERGDYSAGLAITGHSRAFDGRP